MGTGKTTAARMAALRLGVSFLDTDLLIEKKFKLTVSQIFAKKGEGAFRKAETEIIRATLFLPPQVIATGGGAVLALANRDVFYQGIWINLNSDPAVILKRLMGKKNRPLLGKKATREAIESLLYPRLPFYRLAKHQIETGSFSPDAIVDDILKIVRKS